jgi:hypothetical protein
MKHFQCALGLAKTHCGDNAPTERFCIELTYCISAGFALYGVLVVVCVGGWWCDVLYGVVVLNVLFLWAAAGGGCCWCWW